MIGFMPLGIPASTAVLFVSPLIKDQGKILRDTHSGSQSVLLITETLSAVGASGRAHSLGTNSLTFGAHAKKLVQLLP